MEAPQRQHPPPAAGGEGRESESAARAAGTGWQAPLLMLVQISSGRGHSQRSGVDGQRSAAGGQIPAVRPVLQSVCANLLSRGLSAWQPAARPAGAAGGPRTALWHAEAAGDADQQDATRPWRPNTGRYCSWVLCLEEDGAVRDSLPFGSFAWRSSPKGEVDGHPCLFIWHHK